MDAARADASLGDGGSERDASEMDAMAPFQCDEPDFLVLLDRTGTMGLTVASQVPSSVPESKWAQAAFGLQQLLHARVGSEMSPIDQEFRFGLMLWPQAAAGCRSVSEYIAAPSAPFTNPQCQGPELVVPVGLGSSGPIGLSIDTGTTPLCESTPLVSALRGVRGALPALAPGELRRQYVLLVTDGYEAASFCDASQSTTPLEEIQALARDGIRTVVVSLEPAVDVTGIGARLNDFACAGLEAPDFAISCEGDAATGYRARTDVARRLYNDASDSAALVDRLVTIVRAASCLDRVILI